MVLRRWQSMIVAGSLLFAGGCCFCWPARPWLGRHCNGNCNGGCGEISNGETIVSEGPVLMDGSPPMPGAALNAPAPTAPQLSPPPRLVPQAQPSPWPLTGRTSS